MTPQQKIIIQGITKQILSCKHECQITSVRNLIDQAQLNNEQKQVLFAHCAMKEMYLPKYSNHIATFSMFARTAGLPLVTN